MRCVLWLGGTPIEFTESGGKFPYLAKVSRLRNSVRPGYRTGIGLASAASITVTLDNTNGRVASIIGQPLRAPADVYDDADELIWSGIVSGMPSIGNAIELTVGA